MSAPDMGRRSFFTWLVRGAGGALAALVAYPMFRFILPPKIPEAVSRSVLAATLDELAPGSFKIFSFGSEPGLLIRMSDGAYRAFSATCTHLTCTVKFRPEHKDIFCACHDGQYDIEGKNVSGPPPRPLEKFTVHETEEGIVVERGERE